MNENALLLRHLVAGGTVSPASVTAITTSHRHARGVALVLVLAFITLCTVLVVAFFASISTEGVSARATASGNTAAQLAGSAVQLVEGTISYATEPQGDTSFAWACQPGMIRTYGAGGTASADPLAYYKLYSSDNMIVSGKAACNTFTSSNTEVPQHWDFAPSLYADMNAPLIKLVPSGGATPNTSVIFPILDPRAYDLGVEGFSYTNQLDAPISTSVDGVSRVTLNFSKDSGARLPMPVRWMYVLKDGTMTVPDATTIPSSSPIMSATWSGTNLSLTPSKTNPIVGRIAFWTDDESAKVNVNTASEGTYQDAPISNSGSAADAFGYPPTTAVGDYVLARLPGVQHEYQRYPGHPATTCLSSVFGGALSGSRATIVKSITDVVPRITDYTTSTTTPGGISGASTMGGTQAGATAVPVLLPDFDRLYASLDEFQFSPARAVPNLQTTGNAQATAEQNLLDSCRFFVTAHSKAPELNMFGLPRVAIWPLWDTTVAGTLTPFDQEILHCSTVADTANPPHSFAFFRAYPLSATADFPTSGQLPPTGTGLQRNRSVYGYLHSLMKLAVPGFGTSFAAKYNTSGGATDADQILTEIFDYIRCTNLADNSVSVVAGNTVSAVPYTGKYSTTTPNVGANGASPGQVVPIQIPSGASSGANTQGLGRIATIGEMSLVLVKVDDRQVLGSAAPGGTNFVSSISVTGAPGITTVDPTKQTLVEWCLVPKLVSPMCGYVGLSNDIRLKFSNSTLNIGGTPVTLTNVPDLYDSAGGGVGGRIGAEGRDSAMGGNIGFVSLVESGNASPKQNSPLDSMFPTGLCLVQGVSGNSPPTTVGTNPGNTMTVSGGFTVSLYAPAGSATPSGTPLQTFNFSFPTPSLTVPIPQIYINSSSVWGGTFRTSYGAYSLIGTAPSITGKFSYPATAAKSTLQRFDGDRNDPTLGGFKNFTGGNATYSTPGNVGTDVIRSFVATGILNTGGPSTLGDTRVVAASSVLPATLWQTVLTSSGVAPSATTYTADSSEAGTLIPMNGNTRGQLTQKIPNAKYQYPPEVPPLPNGNTAGVTMPGGVPGDWDNAPGLMTDGPWANKPDEGTSDSSNLPYIGNYESMTFNGAPLTTQFSPNRQVSSPVMFGSLPTGVDHPWRTLLFRPAALPGYQNGYIHPGNASPGTTIPDHLLLDLFWMPIVEPYGISEPFATSGKINLNTQIMPFTYIKRTTGLNAVLKAVMITALNPDGTNMIPNGSFNFVGTRGSYKWSTGNTSYPSTTTRYPIDAPTTLGQLDPASPDITASFPEFSRSNHTAAAPNFFVSASQICDVPLYPANLTTSLSSFWGANSLTGDNSLERPYSLIYPRVTTKSNIFTVHVIAQSLKQLPADAAQMTWYENKDQVLSEYRGAYTIEKYFDPNTDNLTDSSGNTLDPSKDDTIDPTAGLRSTKWRLLGVKRFGQ